MPASSVQRQIAGPARAASGDALTARQLAVALAAACALAALSATLVAPAPSYDPWSWLLWGREVAGGALSTAGGPAFKPLPVAVCALLSPLGGAAPAAWVLLARAGALLALWLSFRLGRRLAGGSVVAGALAAATVGLCGTFVAHTASGIVAGWVLALALAGLEAWRAGRPRLALACAVACGLLQVEAWPFVAVLGLWLWRRRPEDRRLLAVAAVGVPALWLAPELIGSGDLLRSAERARVPNSGQPALAEVPALASLEQAARLALWPVWIGVVALALLAWRGRRTARAALLPAVAGAAWIAVVAAMAQLGGFSGEPRYALPGIASIGIAGAVGLVSAGRAATSRPARLLAALACALVAVAALPRFDDLVEIRSAQAYQWQLAGDLADAIDAVGGRSAVAGCGQAFVGPLRGPILAYALGVARDAVEPDLAPAGSGTVFRSRRTASAPIEPAASGSFATVATTERWEILQACGVRMP
jgi:hypothetical protein